MSKCTETLSEHAYTPIEVSVSLTGILNVQNLIFEYSADIAV